MQRGSLGRAVSKQMLRKERVIQGESKGDPKPRNGGYGRSDAIETHIWELFPHVEPIMTGGAKFPPSQDVG